MNAPYQLRDAEILVLDPTPSQEVVHWLEADGATVVEEPTSETSVAVLYDSHVNFGHCLASVALSVPIILIARPGMKTIAELGMLTSGPYSHVSFGTPTRADLVKAVRNVFEAIRD